MLDECYENVDYVSLHRYYGNPTNNTPDFLARNMDMDSFIKTVVSICDAVRRQKAQQEKAEPQLRRMERLVSFPRAGQRSLEAG